MSLPYSSRDVAFLEKELANRVHLAFLEFSKRFPNEPQPFLTQTYRSPEMQNDLYAQGRTKPGKVVTGLRGGQSLHNFNPCFAFDIAFNIPNAFGGPYSRVDLFDKFAMLAKQLDIEWGGDWVRLIDKPHFQVPRYSAEKATSGEPIPWRPLPEWAEARVGKDEPVFKIEVPFERVFLVSSTNKSYELDLEVVNIVDKKLYIKTKTNFVIVED